MYSDLLINDVLTYLFNNYIKDNGRPIFVVDNIIIKHGESPKEVVRYLLEQGLTYPCMHDDRGYLTGITMTGIEKIKPEFIDEMKTKVSSTLSTLGYPEMGIMEILGLEQKDRLIAFDFAEYLQQKGIVDVVTLADSSDVLIKINKKKEVN